MRFFRTVVMFGVVLFSVEFLCAQQPGEISLGEAARQARAAKQKDASKSKHAFTNDGNVLEGVGGDPLSAPSKPGRIKVVYFMDMECSASRAEWPKLNELLRAYPVEIVKADYPLRGFKWSLRAAAFAAYFDASPKLAKTDFREWMLRYQAGISEDNLDKVVTRLFPHEGELDAKMIEDPKGSYFHQAEAARAYAEELGLTQTPSFYVVCQMGGRLAQKHAVSYPNLLSLVRQCQRAMPPAK